MNQNEKEACLWGPSVRTIQNIDFSVRRSVYGADLKPSRSLHTFLPGEKVEIVEGVGGEKARLEYVPPPPSLVPHLLHYRVHTCPRDRKPCVFAGVALRSSMRSFLIGKVRKARHDESEQTRGTKPKTAGRTICRAEPL